MLRRVLLTLPVGMARCPFLFEAPGQALAKSGQIISELLPGRVRGKWQLWVAAICLIPPIGDPLRTFQDKSAKFRQSIHSRQDGQYLSSRYRAIRRQKSRFRGADGNGISPTPTDYRGKRSAQASAWQG